MKIALLMLALHLPLTCRAQEDTDAIRRQSHSILEAESDIPHFIGSIFYVTGTIQISSYYNWKYADAQATHFSFEISDGRSTCQCYMEREAAQGLRKQLLNSDGPIRGTFALEIFPNRYEQGQTGLLAELCSFGPPFDFQEKVSKSQKVAIQQHPQLGVLGSDLNKGLWRGTRNLRRRAIQF